MTPFPPIFNIYVYFAHLFKNNTTEWQATSNKESFVVSFFHLLLLLFLLLYYYYFYYKFISPRIFLLSHKPGTEISK